MRLVRRARTSTSWLQPAALVLALLAAVFAAVRAPAGRADELPYVTAPPFVSGPVQEGLTQVLSVAAGGWGGKHLVFTYRWERCNADGLGCASIPGEVVTTRLASDEYVVTQADAAHRLRVVVTATNAAGSTTRLSNESVVLSAPSVPLAPSKVGTIAQYALFSPALGHVQRVTVYLPPGYQAGAATRFPALFLLHGFPGSPSSFVDGLAVGSTEDQLLAMRLVHPLILVMPDGAPVDRTETSWVDGLGTGRWETFVARDVVRWADRCFRTEGTSGGRGIAGLSDGGYGALNIAIHHPSEFRLVESWSGYEHADPALTRIYGQTGQLLAYDSPAIQLRKAAPTLRRRRVFFWLYIGADDGDGAENAAFASQLSAARVRHSFLIVAGGHLPRVYRANLPLALRVASAHLTGTRNGAPRRIHGSDCSPVAAVRALSRSSG